MWRLFFASVTAGSLGCTGGKATVLRYAASLIRAEEWDVQKLADRPEMAIVCTIIAGLMLLILVPNWAYCERLMARTRYLLRYGRPTTGVIRSI